MITSNDMTNIANLRIQLHLFVYKNPCGIEPLTEYIERFFGYEIDKDYEVATNRSLTYKAGNERDNEFVNQLPFIFQNYITSNTVSDLLRPNINEDAFKSYIAISHDVQKCAFLYDTISLPDGYFRIQL